MKKSAILILGLGLLLVLMLTASCPKNYFAPAPECVQQDLFSSLESNSEAYQKIAQQQLQDAQPTAYRYFFKTFMEEGDKIYMMTSFRNETACFDVKVWVDKWDKLAGMRSNNGKNYPKELYDLTWKLTTVEGESEVRYIDMHRIID